MIRGNDDLVYRPETTTCAQSNAATVTAKQCVVSLDALTVAPHSLVMGSVVYVAIIAGNAFGDSEMSEPGFGATVYFKTDAVPNFENDLAVYSTDTIKLTWG